MTTHLQAYFETEDAALAVQEQLIKYNVQNLEIGLLEDDGAGDNIPLAVPMITGGVSQVSSGIMGGIPIVAETGARAFRDDQYKIYHAVLSGKVATESYEEVVALIESNNGHIEEK